MKKILCLLVLVFTAHVSAEVPFSTNDLSILFPLDTSSNFLPQQRISIGSSSDWKVIDGSTFKNILDEASLKEVFLNDNLKKPENWYLVGMRYSPCIFFAGTSKPCEEQIRFIFQPYNSVRELDGLDDYALHVLYVYNATTPPLLTSDILQAFRELKNDQATNSATLDQPLQPHPVLSSSESGKYLASLQDLVFDKFINDRNPSKATFMGLGKLPDSSVDPSNWIFFAGSVDDSGLWAIDPLPSGIPLDQEILSFEDGNILGNLDGHVSNFNLIDDDLSFSQEITFANKIFDVSMTNDHNVNCMSCHLSDSKIFNLYTSENSFASTGEKDQFIDNIFSIYRDNKRVTEMLIDNKYRVGKRPTEGPIPRIFGYLDGSPLISQRVVDDSASAVQYANSILNLETTEQCKEIDKRKNVLECIVFGDPFLSLESCMQSYCN